MTDFSSPRRMSAVAFLVIWQKAFRDFMGITIVPTAYLLYDIVRGKPIDGMDLLLVAGLIVALPLIFAFVRYYFRKFHIEGDRLVFTHGFAFKKTTSIPLSRIHTLRSKSGLLYRALDLRGVAFDTLATDGQEVELILDEAEWQRLLHRVRAGAEYEPAADDAAVPQPATAPSDAGTQKVSDVNIIKGALCQNHLKGFAILATILLALLDKINQIQEDSTNRIIGYIDSHMGDTLPAAADCILAGAAVYFVVMLLWTGKIVLRYSGMTLSMADSRLTVESGLFSRYTCRMARDKATVLSIKQNPLERAAHCHTVTIRQAENVAATEKEGDVRIYGSNLGASLLEWWLGDNNAAEEPPQMCAVSGRGLFMRKFIPHLLASIAAAFILYHFMDSLVPVVIICSAYTAVMALRAAMAWKHSAVRLYGDYLRIDRGNIARIREYIKYPDIESVGIRSTPFTAFSGRVSLQIFTNAGSCTVFSLETDKACAIRRHILDTHTAGFLIY